eukprot:897735_1
MSLLIKPEYKYNLLLAGAIGLLSSFVLVSYRYQQKISKTVYQIKNIENAKDLMEQTNKLINTEWPNRSLGFNPKIKPQQNAIPADDIPCRRVLIKVSPRSIFDLNTMTYTVIGHIHLTGSFRDPNLVKLRKMLKVGLPVAAVKERIKMSGMISIWRMRFFMIKMEISLLIILKMMNCFMSKIK